MADDDGKKELSQEEIDELVSARILEETGGLGIEGLKKKAAKLLREKKTLEGKAGEFDLDEYNEMKDKHARELKAMEDKHAKALKALEDRNGVLTAALDLEVRQAGAVAAIAKQAPDNVDLLLPHVLSAVAMAEEDGKFSAVVKGENGKSLESYVEGLREKFPAAFPGSGGSGTGGGQNTGGGTGGTVKTISSSDPNFNSLFMEHQEAIGKGEVQIVD